METEISKALANGSTIRMYRGSGKVHPKKKKRHIFWITTGIIYAAMIILNVVSWLSTPFSDWYKNFVFHFIGNVFSRICGTIPFSVGEILICIGLFILLIGPVTLIIALIFGKGKRRRILSFAARFLAVIFAYILVTETMNCFIMYHCTTIEKEFFPEEQNFSVEDLEGMCNFYIDRLNELSAEVERDENGFLYTENINQRCIIAMNGISERFPELRGYYPDAKPIRASMLMTQMNTTGIYFPFTLEANYNAVMSSRNLPDTICHEYSHLKGIIQEDEAGFISYLATTSSGDKELMYSGYMMAFNYSINELYNHVESDRYYEIISRVDQQVWDDDIFITEEYKQLIEDEAVISNETAGEIDTAFTDTNLKLNGIEDGIESYNRIVRLLLCEYYKDRQ